MIVADTSAMLALLDADDRHHDAVRELWEADPDSWVLPWSILPELDYLVRRQLGVRTVQLFLQDVAVRAYHIEYGMPVDMMRACELAAQYRGMELGLVDAVVMAVAERLRASAIATLDLKHFAAVELRTAPRLLPRDA